MDFNDETHPINTLSIMDSMHAMKIIAFLFYFLQLTTLRQQRINFPTKFLLLKAMGNRILMMHDKLRTTSNKKGGNQYEAASS